MHAMIVETYIRANSPHSLYHCFLISVLVSLSVLAAFSVCRAENDSTNRISSPDLTELNVEELMSLDVATVYGASRYEQKVTEAPASVSLVTADEIKKYGYRTLADV